MPLINRTYRVKITDIQNDFEYRISGAINDIIAYFEFACAKQIESGIFDNHVGIGLTYRGQLLQNLRRELDESLHKTVVSDTPYSLALNFGRLPGKMPPVNPLIEWFRIKIRLPPQEAKKAGWALAKKFEREGMDPKPFFTNATLETLNPNVIRRILRDWGFNLS